MCIVNAQNHRMFAQELIQAKPNVPSVLGKPLLKKSWTSGNMESGKSAVPESGWRHRASVQGIPGDTEDLERRHTPPLQLNDLKETRPPLFGGGS